MKIQLAVAALMTFGGLATFSANAGEASGDQWGVRSADASGASASARVRMAFSVHRDVSAPTRVALRAKTRVESVSLKSSAVAEKPRTPWYGLDRSLQRGDIVVTETGALVYEGEKNGKRHFKTVGLSRLVSVAERQRIIESARR